MIGAQVFVEPGQSEDQVANFFRILSENNMPVCRIRMFENHMLQRDGSWDFSLYDAAFRAAEKYNIAVFATLFPTSDADDLAGFKFPDTQAQLDKTAVYIEKVVNHFKQSPALHTWVLQNEPGGTNPKILNMEYIAQIYDKWIEEYEPRDPSYTNDYLKTDFTFNYFVNYVMNYYLSWISEQVKLYDTEHYHHLNPHAICDNFAEYDFSSFEEYLDSIGISMHMSWHFGNFRREQYPMGVAFMSSLIRPAGLSNPFWITELQGGNVTYSGKVALCPTKEEIAQWLWTGIGSGTEGIIFWSLNQRASGKEAGEWGMIDFQGKPSDRLTMASEVSKCVMENKDFFASSAPVVADVTLAYTREAAYVAAYYEDGGSPYPARKSSAMMRSIIADYEALCAHGISPAISDVEHYDWDVKNPKGKVVIFPNVIAIASWQWEKINKFVERGGSVVMTGLSGYYDQNAHCVMQTGFPFEQMLGGNISEYKHIADNFTLPIMEQKAKVSMWKGIIAPTTAEVISRDGDEVIAVKNKYGKGEAIWIPSLIELGSVLTRDNAALIEIMGQVAQKQIQSNPFSFSQPQNNIQMNILESKGEYMMVVINKNKTAATITLNNSKGLKATKIFGQAELNGSTLILPSEACAVYRWAKR